jgi:arginyl-tRNA synthetase
LKTSDENPVYYVQYAHARICSALANWGGDEATLAQADLSYLSTPHEASLLSKLAAYPEVLQRAQAELGPHQVAFYLRELAGELHSYYFAHKWLLDDDQPLKLARLALATATRQVLRNGLALIGVSAPNKMERAPAEAQDASQADPQE